MPTSLVGLPESDRAAVVSDHDVNIHYSQLGEDVVVNHLFECYVRNAAPGTYVDVGAFHPRQYSNTQLLYMKGWRGLNIDASPSAIELFKSTRPDDVSVCSGIAREAERRPFYVFSAAAASTFDPDTRDAWLAAGWPMVDTLEMEVAPLSDILDRHLATDRPVDFLNVDIEGLDLEALETYDFARRPPAVVAVEIHGLDLLTCAEHPTVRFMVERGYRLQSYTVVTAIFMRG